jgi:hypothetical protein
MRSASTVRFESRRARRKSFVPCERDQELWPMDPYAGSRLPLRLGREGDDCADVGSQSVRVEASTPRVQPVHLERRGMQLLTQSFSPVTSMLPLPVSGSNMPFHESLERTLMHLCLFQLAPTPRFEPRRRAAEDCGETVGAQMGITYIVSLPSLAALSHTVPHGYFDVSFFTVGFVLTPSHLAPFSNPSGDHTEPN